MGLFDSKTQQRELGWGLARDALKRNVVPQLDDYSDQYGQGQGIYKGNRLANENKFVREGQKWQANQAQGMKSQLKGVTDTVEGFLDYDPNSPINQARRDAFGDQALNNFERNARPTLENRSTMAGQFGGPQQDIAVGTAMGDTMRDINSFEAEMMNQDRTRAFQAMSQAPGIYASQLMPGSVMETIGNQRSQRNQAELQDSIQMQEAERNAMLRSMQEQQGMTIPLLQAGTKSTQSSSPSGLQTALGVASLGADLYTGGGFSAAKSLFGGGSGAGSAFGGPGTQSAMNNWGIY